MDEKTRWIIKAIVVGFILALVTNAIAIFIVWLAGGFRPVGSCDNGVGMDCMYNSPCAFMVKVYGIFLLMLLIDCAIGVLLFLYSLTRRGKSREKFMFWAGTFIVAGAFSWLFKVALVPILLSWLLGGPLYPIKYFC